MRGAILTHPQNLLGGVTQRIDANKRSLRLPLRIAMIDEKTGHAGALSGLDVAPAVADHERASQVDAVPAGRVEERPRLRLAAVAVVAVVPADDDVVERQRGAELLVHRLDDLAALRAAGHVGLV